MNKDKLLDRLNELKKQRGDLSAFANHDEFLQWSDQVAPLLSFDEVLHRKFGLWVSRGKSAFSLGHDHHDGLGEAIGVVNQAITKLEFSSEQSEDIDVVEQTNLDYPEKITLSWLYQHVPIKL